MAAPLFAVFPSLEVRGWNAAQGEAPSRFVQARLLSVAEFSAPQATDAMFAVYELPGEETWPRLNLPALPVLEGLGLPPRAVWAVVDVDVVPGHAPWPSPEAAEAHIADLLDPALTASASDPLLASASVYSTRGGYRLLWRLSTPLPVGKYRALMSYVHARLAALGVVGLDATADQWTRLFRLPMSARDGVLPGALTMDLTPIETGVTLDPYSFGELWDDEDAVAEVAGDQPLEPKTLTLDDLKAAWRLPWLRRGEPVPPDAQGHTYTALRAALANLASEGPVTDPHTLLSLVWASVEATPGRSLLEAWKLASWIAAKQRGHLAKPKADMGGAPVDPEPLDEATWAALETSFDGRKVGLLDKLRAGHLLARAKCNYGQATHEAVTALARQAKVFDPETLYRAVWACASAQAAPTSHELWQWCKDEAERARVADDAKQDGKKLATVYCDAQPLTIKVVGEGGGAWWQLDTRTQPPTYRPTDKDSLPLHHKQFTQPGLPFDVDMMELWEQRGGMGLILHEYGRTVETVTYESGLRGARYDEESDALRIGVHALDTRTTPRYHAEVQAWLEALGGDDPGRFLDWLAVLTYTHSPVCSLYIEGRPGIGKSMLAYGIASLWAGAEAPVPYTNVSAGFNAAMLACPLVFADEGIQVSRENSHSASEDFRNLIANSAIEVKAKYKNNAVLNGCFRVLIAANDSDGIPFRKALGEAGLAAVVQRVAYIRADSEKTAEVLANLSGGAGRMGTHDWVKKGDRPGKIAEHLLWLKDNRTPCFGARFLVEGRETDWHRAFMANQGIKPDVLRVVCRLAQNMKTGKPAGGVQIVKREVRVTQAAIEGAWDQFGRAERPLPQTLKQTLAQLNMRNGQDIRVNGMRAYAIDMQTLEDLDLVAAGHLDETPAEQPNGGYAK